MRLTKQQVESIKNIAKQVFGDKASVLLFGSRVDDSKKGGDIDLCIETDIEDIETIVKARNKFTALLKQKIGDQKIDVVLSYPAGPHLAIHKIAHETGVYL